MWLAPVASSVTTLKLHRMVILLDTAARALQVLTGSHMSWKNPGRQLHSVTHSPFLSLGLRMVMLCHASTIGQVEVRGEGMAGRKTFVPDDNAVLLPTKCGCCMLVNLYLDMVAFLDCF